MARVAAEVVDLSIGYGRGGDRRILMSGVNFILNRGEMALLIGQNGVGKSTLLRTMAAVQPPLRGKVLINGEDLRGYDARTLSRLVSVVLTDKTLAGGLLVSEVVSLGRHPYTGFFGRLSAEDDRVVEESLVAVGIADKSSAFLSQLSDGERQKVMIAKALAQQSQLILLDEPTAFLDLPSRMEILFLLKRLAVEQDKTILLSTHDIEQSLMVADKVVLLSGSGLLCGTTEEVVEGGGFEGLFAGRGVDFDTASGRFIPSRGGAEVLHLSASGALEYWVENVVRGAGFDVVKGEDVQTRIKVRCTANGDIELECEGRRESFDSLSSLAVRLREFKSLF